jgi:hypothetical protein
MLTVHSLYTHYSLKLYTHYSLTVHDTLIVHSLYTIHSFYTHDTHYTLTTLTIQLGIHLKSMNRLLHGGTESEGFLSSIKMALLMIYIKSV